MELISTFIILIHVAWFCSFLSSIDMDFGQHRMFLINLYKTNKFQQFLTKSFRYVGTGLLKYAWCRTYPAFIFALITALVVGFYSGSFINIFELIQYMMFIECIFIMFLIISRLIINIIDKIIYRIDKMFAKK